MRGHRADPYLDWRRLKHGDDCPTTGWEVRQFSHRDADDVEVEVGMRAYCTTCHASYELVTETGQRDQWGQLVGPCVDGGPRPPGLAEPYAAGPVQVAAVWMHPERGRHPHGLGWHHWYVTRSPEQPQEHREIVGIVHSTINRVGNTKWVAVLVSVHETRAQAWRFPNREKKAFDSPRAAGKWIATQLATEDGGGAR